MIVLSSSGGRRSGPSRVGAPICPRARLQQLGRAVAFTHGASTRPRRWQAPPRFHARSRLAAYDCATARGRDTRMTEIYENSEATQAARDAAERVRTSAADGAESFGATAEQINDDVTARAEAAK